MRKDDPQGTNDASVDVQEAQSRLRDTKYARLIGDVSVQFPSGSEARLERLFIKEHGREEVRFSWWKDSNMMMRPLDLSEEDMWQLIAKAIQAGLLCRPSSVVTTPTEGGV
jgi:hypothetical protein